MVVLPLFRVITFTLVTLFSLVVLGICAHIEYLVAGYTDSYLSFSPFGLGAACLTILSLPLFLVLGNRRQRVFTSTIVFEVIWFFILWVVWVGTAGDAVAGKAYYFPFGCDFNDYYSESSSANQICYEFTVVEAFAFSNFFCAFIYYDVIVLYAIINTIRGRGVWTASVKEAVSGTLGAVNPAPMVQPQFNAAPTAQYQSYGAYPTSVPLAQPYSPYPQQVPPQAPAAPPYGAYPQQVPPQAFPPQPYNAYPNQPPPQGLPTMQPGQNQPCYNPPPAAPQQHASYAGFSPTPPTIDAPHPPQPNYSSYPVNLPQDPLPLPSGYQEHPIPAQHQLQSPPPSSPYSSHQVPPV